MTALQNRKSWLRSGTLSAKMRKYIGISTIIGAIVSMIAVIGIFWMISEGKVGLANTKINQLLIHSMQEIGSSRASTVNYIQTGDMTALATARDGVQKASKQISEAADVAPDSNIIKADALTDIKDELSKLDNLFSMAANSPTVAPGLRTQIITQNQTVFAKVSSMTSGLSNAMMKPYIEKKGGVYILLTVLVLLGLTSIASFILAPRFIEKEFLEPLQWTQNSLAKLMKAESDVDIRGLDREDEFGQMAKSLYELHSFSGQYKDMLESKRQATEDKLREQMDREAEREQHAQLLRQLADRFETTVGEVVGGVASASSQLQHTAASMASAAEQSSHQARQVTSSLTEASSGVTAAAAASDEFAMSIGEISRQAATSAELARKATIAASGADATISALTESAVQVGEVVELISSIAQRTNLLALNASIEAARGGEAGRGFAVVASEVKELATQTGKATEEVAGQIRAIQETTTASVQALRSVVQQIQQLEATSVSIAAAVDQQSIAGQDLARSIDMAARNTEEVSSSIVHVRESSQAAGTAASQVLSSSAELEQQASTLKTHVDQFLQHVRAA